MQAQARQRERMQVSVPEFLVWLAVSLLLMLVLWRVTRGLSDAGRWACLYVAPAAAGALAFFVSRLAKPGLARGCALGVVFGLAIGTPQVAEPLIGSLAACVIAVGSYVFVNLTLSAAFELGRRRKELPPRGR